MHQYYYRLALLLTLAFTGQAQAQPERHELGRRLKLLEIAWEKHEDRAARKRALEIMPKVMQQFFTFQYAEAGRTLDSARWALQDSDPQPAALRWIEPIYLAPGGRLIDADEKELPITIAQFYKPDVARPDRLGFHVRWPGEKAKELTAARFPMKTTLELPAFPPRLQADTEELALEFTVELEGKLVASQMILISRVVGLKERLAKLKKVAANLPDTPTIESATLTERVELLGKLAAGQTLETDYPAGKLLVEAETIARAGVNKHYFTADRPGSFWLSVPTAAGKQTACRVFVPKGLDARKPVPVVVALHGAGGSENLFFEGYGNGIMVKECEKRGWILIAPRSALSFVGNAAPPVGDLLDVLGKRYPIDPALAFLVGHSMGAVQTIDAVQAYPGRLAAAAALGGGGRVRKPERFRSIPLFVGVGSNDFALAAAKSLSKALTDANAGAAAFREYADIEHMLIVREALPDVFSMFDKLARPVK